MPYPEAFSMMEDLLQRAQAHTREGLVEVLGKAIEAISSADALGFFKNYGYRYSAQSL